LAPRRSKETQKTGDHGGIVRQPKRHCLLLTDAGIPHLLEDGYRALRAPASALMSSASSHTPGTKTGGSLRLSRWLPQPAAQAAAFCDDNAGGDGGLAQDSRGTPWQSAGEHRQPRKLSCCSVRRSGQRRARSRTARLPHAFLSNAASRRSQGPQPPAA
ncbi:MAG: hypothetical protein V3R72_09510, partial [Gammaproteobacteria bacterium]